MKTGRTEATSNSRGGRLAKAIRIKETADGGAGRAHGHLDYLKCVGDPATDLPIGDSLARQRPGKQLAPALGPEALMQLFHVVMDRMGADVEVGGDLLFAQALAQRI